MVFTLFYLLFHKEIPYYEKIHNDFMIPFHTNFKNDFLEK